MPGNNLSKLVEAYINYQKHSLDSDWWAWFEVDSMVRDEPESAWPVIMSLLTYADSQECLPYIAAGPLEDWIVKYGDSRIEFLTGELENNAQLQDAITRVSLREKFQTSQRLVELRQSYVNKKIGVM